MEKTTAKRDAGRMISESRAALDEIVRQGAQRMLQEALEAILGPQEAARLSATNIVRLKEGWREEYESWAKRDLSDRRYVYWRADGIYFNVRLDTERLCLLILMGALEDGTKELVAVWDGHRESKASWLEVLRDLKARGLSESPQLAVGDGALGF
jgi:Transposase and inactivated derivatives